MRCILLLQLMCNVFSSVVCSAPEQSHLSLTHNATEMAVTYVTRPKSNPMPASVVFYGESANSLSLKQTGSAKTYSDGGWDGWIHNVVLSGLKPNKTYYYRCGEERDGGTVHNFTSPPQSNDTYPITVAFFADLGEECALVGCGNLTFDRLTQGTLGGLYDLIVHAGDIAYTSGHQSVWDDFFAELEPIAANRPYMTIPGNHEHWFNFSGYNHRFYMPGEAPGTVNNLWNSYDFAGIHFVAVSTEHDFTPGSMQYNWLKSDLAKAQQNRGTYPWLIMYGHRPFYCSSSDYYDCHIFGPKKFRPAIEPLLREYDVDMYLSGHLHNYECMWPVYNGTVLSHSYTNPPSTIHVIAGMAGCSEGLTHKFSSPTPAWSNVRHDTLGYVVFTVESPTKLTWRYLSSLDNSVIHSFTLSKSRG